jgi:hypothetical protein
VIHEGYSEKRGLLRLVKKKGSFPSEALRYNERTAAERFNSRLKGEFGGEPVMVRGYRKVKLHLMFGVIALFADQLLKLST